VKFWDSSAVIPLLIAEPRTREMTSLLRTDRESWIWWTTRTECLSGLHRRVRAGELDSAGFSTARQRLVRFDQAASTIVPSEAIRTRAERLLGVHPLRSADALQLAASLVAAEDRPAELPFVTLDDRLAEAARKEGFSVLPG
jgi:predicted nucleic acid-binding protein